MNSFPLKVFSIKENLVCMNNFYHKLAVVSVCTALNFALVANKEAKAATLGYQATTTFFIENFPRPYIFGNEGGGDPGSGDRLYTHLEGEGFFIVMKTRFNSAEKRSFHEFSIDHLSLIKKAIFSFELESQPGNYGRWALNLNGYVGNGMADLSDYGNGKELDSYEPPKYPGRIEFDVTQFVKKLVSNQDDFAGFSTQIGGKSGKVNIYNTYFSQPLLIIETADVAEPVPEPTTIFGSALALSLGGWLKRKKSNQQNKTTL